VKNHYLATATVALLSLGAIASCAQPPTTAVPSPSQSVSAVPSTAMAKANILRSGNFVAAEHPTSGTARIVTENGQNFLEFDRAFKTDSGPDLYVVLHRAPNILAVTTPPNYGIKEGDYVSLGRLKSTTGSQRYAIPKTVKLENFKSAAVWCRQFNATFGAAGFSQ
jgi:hypothetical protein